MAEDEVGESCTGILDNTESFMVYYVVSLKNGPQSIMLNHLASTEHR